MTPMANKGTPSAALSEKIAKPPAATSTIAGRKANRNTTPPRRTPPAICLPHVCRIRPTDSVHGAEIGPLSRSMIIGRTKNEMTDHTTAANDASTSLMMLMKMLSPPLPWIIDSSQPTRVWIAAQPRRAGRWAKAAPMPAPNQESRGHSNTN